MKSSVRLLALTSSIVACNSSPASTPDAGDAGLVDGAPIDTRPSDVGVDTGAIDAGTDGAPPDVTSDAMGPTYSCGAFSESPGWTLASGLRAVIVADENDELQEPVGIVFAHGAFGGRLYVSDQRAQRIFSVDIENGNVDAFARPSAFPAAPTLLTAITWDAENIFDGNLYVVDSVSASDQDDIIYRVTSSGSVSVFARAPGPALDEIYGLAFAPRGAPVGGLFAAGDTDGSGPDWAVFNSAGIGTAFSEVAGVEGIVFDSSGRYGEGPIAARPTGGGYAGDGSITRLDYAGVAQPPLISGLGGVHANVIAPPGLFGGEMIAASWSTGTIFRVSPAGGMTMIASGLALTNYDANILAVSPDGRVLIVADRLASTIVCIEELRGS